MDENKYAFKIKEESIFSPDYEESNYINFSDSIDDNNRHVILKKFESAIENLKTALSFAGTCAYAYNALKQTIQTQAKLIRKEFLFSKINSDFYQLTCSPDSCNSSDAFSLYNQHPNVLFFIGKTLTYKLPYKSFKKFGDQDFINANSCKDAQLSFIRILDHHIEKNQLAMSQPICFTEITRLQHHAVKNAIVQKILCGAFSRQKNKSFVIPFSCNKNFKTATLLNKFPITIECHKTKNKKLFQNHNCPKYYFTIQQSTIDFYS